MKSLLSLGLIFIVLSFSGCGDPRTSGGPANSVSNAAGSSSPFSPSGTLEKPQLTSPQQAIQDAATEIKWDDEGISWKLPPDWTKAEISKGTFSYKAPDGAAFIVNIAVIPEPVDVSGGVRTYYDQALEHLKNGMYSSVRMLELDGLPGVEFAEAKDSDGLRHRQWVAYRTYQSQKQMVNVTTSAAPANFDKHADDFAAIMYSMKFAK